MSIHKRDNLLRAARARNLEKRIIERVDMVTCFNLTDKNEYKFHTQHDKWRQQIDELFCIKPDYEKAWDRLKQARKSG